MELRRLYSILAEDWWMIAGVAIVITGIALIVGLLQPPQYQAEMALVIVPRRADLADEGTALDSVDTLDKRSIAETFGEAVRSRTTMQRSSEVLDLDLERMVLEGELEIKVLVVPDTNVIRIQAQSANPAQAALVANQLGVEAMSLVSELTYPYSMQVLDIATLPEEPVSPGLLFNAVLGLVVGLLTGFAFALAVGYLKRPLAVAQGLSMFDPVTTVMSADYLFHRLQQEIGRVSRRSGPLCFGLLAFDPTEAIDQLDPGIRDQILRQLGIFLQDHIPDGDLLGRVGQYTFGLVMPESVGNEAVNTVKTIFQEIRPKVFSTDGNSIHANFIPYAGVVESFGRHRDREEIVSQARLNLEKARAEGPNHIVLESAPQALPFTETDIENLLYPKT